MSDELILEQYGRLLDGLSQDPWADLEASGFLDLLRPAEDGGADLDLEGLFPLAFETGRRARSPRVIETMVARLVAPQARDVEDLEAVLAAAGVDRLQARALAAAVDAALMSGAIDALLQISIDYAGTRRQFGREISKYQVIQHHIAVLAEEAMAARMAAQVAFSGPVLEISVRKAAAAKVCAGKAAAQASAIAHAIHGAIGVSLEHDLHLYTGGLQARRLSHGGESFWARELGRWALASREDATTLARTL